MYPRNMIIYSQEKNSSTYYACNKNEGKASEALVFFLLNCAGVSLSCTKGVFSKRADSILNCRRRHDVSDVSDISLINQSDATLYHVLSKTML